MSFNTALSGINAAQKDLNVTANNIANVNTTGFKESRAEFADVYANSIFTNSKTAVGGGVSTTQVAQQFHQGNLLSTNNALDMAINGNGFFVTSSGIGDQDFSYTRAGAFKRDDSGFLVDSMGNYLQAFQVDSDGNAASVSLSTTRPVQIPDTAGSPQATSEVGISMNLDSSSETYDPTAFDPTDSSTFNNSTAVTIYDSLGESHTLTSYFVRPNDAAYTGNSSWVAYYAIDGQPVNLDGAAGTYDIDVNGDGTADGTPQTATTAGGWTGAVLSFDASGNFTGSSPTSITTQQLGIAGANVLGASADGTQQLDISFNTPTQFAESFSTTSLTQNGVTVGRLTNVEVGTDGVISATYSNGSTVPLGQVALVRFANEQGLTQVGNTSWKASLESGEALAGEANTGIFGAIRSSSLEQSNVDLTTELVDLISAQRNFQANSRTLEVNNTLQQTILQIR
ncbi:flagellar hook protein FlgE [Shewanella sp.]|uniref:flagellar hook protein FlgE n=1 Tax=Shewanella sp. TaxID=50422 RepID=UPI003A96B2D2